jgi:hypothetical protein
VALLKRALSTAHHPGSRRATQQLDIGDDAIFCRAGTNTVRSDDDGRLVLPFTVSR